MIHRSLYVIETGELTGLCMLADDSMLALNTPPGHAWVKGELDPRRSLVRLVTDDLGEQVPVVDALTPPQPVDSAYQTWGWDETRGDWVATPTLLLQQIRAREPVLVLLEQLDAKQARPVGEIAVAQALGDALPAAAVERLQSINADKAALRGRLAAIAATADADELEALLAVPVALQTALG